MLRNMHSQAQKDSWNWLNSNIKDKFKEYGFDVKMIDSAEDFKVIFPPSLAMGN